MSDPLSATCAYLALLTYWTTPGGASADHVSTDQHWRHKRLRTNGLA
ncbi:MAG: hypothetical protein OK454_00210 [Thaumarchaeota archaeon]|nr:hypothetical protein [Nitrososphaerota archaeon]